MEHKEGPWGSRGQEGYTAYVDQHATGAMTPPARGYTEDEWRLMNDDQQRAARQVQFDADSEEQREWERRAHEEWEVRQKSPSPLAGEGGADFQAPSSRARWNVRGGRGEGDEI